MDKNMWIEAAKDLLDRIEKTDPQCAFWVVSAITKLKRGNPKMSMTCLCNIVEAAMPKATTEFRQYLKES